MNIVHIRDYLAEQYSRMNLLSRTAVDIGDYKMSARSNDYNGWLLCDGRELEASEYKGLFTVIGTTFGASSSNVFKLPDFRGRVIGQAGSGAGLSVRALGDIVGSETHTLTVNQIPGHTHVGTTSSSGDHTHTATASNAGAHTHSINDPGHTHTQTTINDDFNNSGTTPPGFTADSAGSMTWNNINTSTTGITVNSSGSHSHDITVASAGTHSHSFVTSSVGSGQSHNIMQPTLFGMHMFIYGGI